jgi:hypothetical protein
MKPVTPPHRYEIPAHFSPVLKLSPHYMDAEDYQAITDTLKTEVARQGIGELKRLYIAYSHKHPDVVGYEINPSIEQAVSLQNIIQHNNPAVEIIRLDGLCEMKKLSRSENQDILYALTTPQEFVYDPSLQKTPAPIFDGGTEPHAPLVLLADDIFEKGTTMAHLYSALKHQGAEPLMLVTENGGWRFARHILWGDTSDDGIDLAGVFNTQAHHMAKIPALAHHLSIVTEGQKTPVEAIKAFNDYLHENKNSVFALTQGEMASLIHEIKHNKGFASPLKKILGVKA